KSFKDRNNDGIGDLPGIIEKLPYLQSLGVTMLWISPFYLSPMADNGYDIADYYAVNPEFGEMRDVDTLIDKAAALGIKIMIDLVVNHTSDEHQWFQQALADADSPYRDYYLFRPAVNGLPPNNWRSIFGGSAWEKVPGDDTYYLHEF
ncbi:alpha-amylase family glycosyl hydrolase, partial [Klebsiella pneumoniae]|uniref:alpha-amylase family glycosyl hydrolase n=1 Tax=Klebsiella pneumoniae TaxID=573 RepID=UPI002380DAAC